MPRRQRVVIEGGIYHVYNRCARGAELFSEPDEAIELTEILRKATDRDGLRIYAWVLMSNHVHLAVRLGPVPLARTMAYVQARFGQGYNRRHRSSGPRWQSRYKARLVDAASLRRLIAALGIERWGVTAKSLGKLLGRWPEAVSRWASRGAEMRLESADFRAEYERLDRALAGDDPAGDTGTDARQIVGPGTQRPTTLIAAQSGCRPECGQRKPQQVSSWHA